MCFICDAKTRSSPTTVGTSARGPWNARRGFLLAAAAAATEPALAQVDVGSASGVRKLVPAETLEKSATQQYAQVIAEARSKGALGPDDHPQVLRLRAIAKRLIPYTPQWNNRVSQWRWEVNLIGSKELNAWCMPGGSPTRGCRTARGSCAPKNSRPNRKPTNSSIRRLAAPSSRSDRSAAATP